MKIAQPIINEITPESSALLIIRGAHKRLKAIDHRRQRIVQGKKRLANPEPGSLSMGQGQFIWMAEEPGDQTKRLCQLRQSSRTKN